MRFFRDSEESRKVFWYFVPDDRPFMPFGSAFGSGLYDEVDIRQDQPGEIGPREYYGGQPPCPSSASGLCGDQDQWTRGASIADPLPDVWPGTNLPKCCTPPLVGCCGGVAIGRLGFGACHMQTTCDIYSPFGAGAPSAVNVPCQFVDDLLNGRGTAPVNTVSWTHYIDVAQAVAIVDGCTRTAALDNLNYFDGDEVRIPTGGTARYVVVWVTLCDSEGTTVKRCYLLRHSV